jgi:site-specific recombinase XerD
VGLRDYAIVLLLVRLGLRAGEVVAMKLEDIDWSRGELLVQGKGGRQDWVPLSEDVGEALVAYLQHGRPRPCPSRKVFLRLHAPHRGFASSSAITAIVRRAFSRAGLHPGRGAAHVLRHSLAVEVLRRGAGLSEVADLLRHRHLTTTQIYAKVDIEALRSLALPWPGGAQ